MITLPYLDERRIEFYPPEGLDIQHSIRHSLLFCRYEGQIYAIVPKRRM
jgi:hypothetical protein